MEEYGLIITITYLYVIFILNLELKTTYKRWGILKLILLVFVGFSLYYLLKDTNQYLLIKILTFAPIPFLLVAAFKDEIYVVFVKLGIAKKSEQSFVVDNELAEELLQAVEYLSKRRIGALITIERKTDLSKIINKALMINADVSKELLTSIFIPNAPLHDGAVIIRGNKVLCAKAYYPASERNDLPMHLGTRHRAALGLSEHSDAFTIIVSEETGNVSITFNKSIEYNISKETLSLYFEKFLKVS